MIGIYKVQNKQNGKYQNQPVQTIPQVARRGSRAAIDT